MKIESVTRIKRKAWVEGARTFINGGNFSMNPYSPPPNATNAGRYWDTEDSRYRNLPWTQGYWWANKHRKVGGVQ